jgi:SAM-dependent methyltransferase
VPPERDGIPLLAPELADEAPSGFDAEVFAQLADIEAQSFWFVARNRLIAWALGRYFPAARSMLEVGCGTGFVSAGLREAYPRLRLVGGEISAAGLHRARQRVPDAEFLQMSASALPYEGEFDVVGAFDVLEHIEDDGVVLAEMRRAAKPGGGVLLTVPQHRFLWSPADELSGHERRYSRRELLNKLRVAGFRAERVTSFVSLLLPAMFVARRRLRRHPERYDPSAELVPGRVLSAAMERVMRLETSLIRSGVSLPLGGSLLVAARTDA